MERNKIWLPLALSFLLLGIFSQSIPMQAQEGTGQDYEPWQAIGVYQKDLRWRQTL